MPTKNNLMKKLGILSSDPMERFWENPCGEALRNIGKANQTEEMIAAAIENDSGRMPFLKYISRRKLTREICLAACRKCGRNIEQVPKDYLDADMYMAAIASAPDMLKSVPEEFITLAMCKLALDSDVTGEALKGVPTKILEGRYGQELSELAVQRAPKAIKHVPKKYLTKEMLLSAIQRDAMSIKFVPKTRITKAMALAAIEGTKAKHAWTTYGGFEIECDADDWPIAYLPERLISQQMADRTLKLCPRSIKAVPRKYLSEQSCLEAVKADPNVYRLIPEPFNSSQAVIEIALNGNPYNVHHVPKTTKLSANDFEDYRAYEKAVREERKPFEAELLAKFTSKQNKASGDEIIDYRIKALNVPDAASTRALVRQTDGRAIVHEIANPDEPDVRPVYYISDVHLCHQIALMSKSWDEVKKELAYKVKHLVDSITTEQGTVVVAGDVADSVEIARLFYHALVREMESRGFYIGKNWRVLAILGNHELWDGNPDGAKPIRPTNEVVDSYRKMLTSEHVTLMQNDLLVDYKRNRTRQIDEQTLLDADEKELREILLESPFIMIGGIGFTGLNPRFNADAGIYGYKPAQNGATIPRLSHNEDVKHTGQFRTLYDKLLKCAADRQVIVVTHTPMHDWSHTPYNPNWIYISGHTHQNSLIREENGITVLSDNQVGYKPKPWHFNVFTYRGRYDPFERWDDGIYNITPEQYEDFNNGRGIAMGRLKWPGQIRMVKRAGVYMFFLESSSLLMLVGGGRQRVTHSIEYYYENMPLYQQRVKHAFAPYHNALMSLSKEIKAFGGMGTVHGCIVDIDWFNHVYLNPFDGKVTPYFAWDTSNKVVFDSISALLEESPLPPQLPNGDFLKSRFKIADNNGELSILSIHADNTDNTMAAVPELVLDRSMYNPSRIMRSVQYIFNQAVVRVWNDDIFGEDVPQDRFPIKPAKKPKGDLPPGSATETKPAALSPEQKLRKRAERYAEKIHSRSDGNIAVDVPSYAGARDKVIVKCKICGRTWSPRADKLLEKCYCPECSKKKRR